jgi:hypothetical protein
MSMQAATKGVQTTDAAFAAGFGVNSKSPVTEYTTGRIISFDYAL